MGKVIMDRFASDAQILRSTINIYKILIINMIVMDGIIELYDEGSNDEKMSGIMTKHRIFLFYALKAYSLM